MQTVKRTVVILAEGEEVTIETHRETADKGKTVAACTVKADYRGDESEGTAMLVIVSLSNEMLDDDAKEVSMVTVESQKANI
jgi:hypothetical protein